jgi:hypothetical protein
VKRLDLSPIVMAGLAIGMMSLACGKQSGEDDDTTGVSTLPLPTSGMTEGPSTAGEEDTGEKLDVGGGTGTTPGCQSGDVGCTDQIDLLFVIDNSGTMGEEQINLARNFPLLIERLENLTDSKGDPVNADVNIMVTTSDFGNPLCTPFEPPGYDPARGAPVSTACTSRLQDFTDLTGTNSVPEACQNTCPAPVQPSGPYIHFTATDDNIPDTVVPTDIDGDGDLDSPAAQALACIGPQGINGCGYESQLENMLQALNPSAAWNSGPTPFLRPNALLAVAMVTDEADCSVKNYSIMEDPAFQNTNPNNMMKAPSSAICWNAGVECVGPDANGVFSGCTPRDADDLQPITRYTNYLINELRENQGKEVIMLGILGVPLVTAHNPDPPYQPIAGGVESLVYRNWRDGQYPAGDILPSEFAMNVTAAHKQFDFGIGPGCTGTDLAGNFTGQAIPPVRIRKVCEDLNYVDSSGKEQIRCCIESICDDDFSPAIECLTGIIQESIQLPG